MPHWRHDDQAARIGPQLVAETPKVASATSVATIGRVLAAAYCSDPRGHYNISRQHVLMRRHLICGIHAADKLMLPH
jgi:hypothetical protein